MSKLTMQVAPSDLYLSIRGIRYAFHEAVADLVDNSVDADATNIWIKTSKEEIIIADNGSGMTADQLEEAITPWRAGAKDKKVRRGKRGKFGIGMKSASFSLGKCLEIHTKHTGKAFEYIKLDEDEISKFKDPNHVFETENKVTELFKSYCKDGTGTVLRISKVNTRKVTDQAIQSLHNLLGLVYFSLLQSDSDAFIKILINNQNVKSLDPLMRGLKKNQKKNHYELFEKKTIHIENESTKEKATFKIQGAYVGRGNFWTEEDNTSYRYFLKRNPSEDDTLKRGLLKLDEQGLYILRNGRLITLGGWHGLASANTLLHHNASTRVVIDFDEEGDEMMGLDNTKTILKIEETLKEKLGSYVRAIVNEGEKHFRKEGEIIEKLRIKAKGSKDINEKGLKRDSALAQYQLEQQRQITIPEFEEKQSAIKGQQAEEALESKDLIELKEKLAYNNLWDFEVNQDGETLLLFNENHPGYAALFLEIDEIKVKKNIEFFFYTLATHEASIKDLFKELKPSAIAELEKAFKTYRRWISKHYTEF